VSAPQQRLPEQARAADPQKSVWVSANAGSGKTSVLADRVIRLLLGGTDPGRILCLTFTKAAAAEMSNRVFHQLAGWATAPKDRLLAELAAISHTAKGDGELDRARTLFARVLETPGGLKFQTIHAFCERLLHQFPFEANVPAHFEVIEDGEKAVMLKDAQFDVIREALDNPDGDIATSLDTLVSRLADTSFEKLLDGVIKIEADLYRWVDAAGGLDAGLAGLADWLGVEPGDTVEKISGEMLNSPILPQSEWTAIAATLDGGSENDKKRANKFRDILVEPDPVTGAESYMSIFLTQKNQPAVHLLTKAVKDPHPDLERRFRDEQDRVFRLAAKLPALELLPANRALFTFGIAVLDRFRDRKLRAGKLEYSDLIANARRLLDRSEAASWVLYKLDGGIDHILVDEAQDTSPEQWDIVRLLAEEALSGEGARGLTRTIFAVGDEKQSIFSFQGAEPERFDEMRRYFRRKVEAIERPWDNPSLNLSFRSVPAILEAVDLVCGQTDIRTCLTSANDPVAHGAHRANKPGLVEIWPVEAPDELVDPVAWDAPLDSVSQGSAWVKLAEKIANTIARWLREGETLAASGRAITPGDILILVRRRTHIVTPLIKALRDRKVAVAGADRLELQSHLAVMDLLAAADFALLPEDDLTLATLLRSPFFGVSEENLYLLAYNRPGSLWNALQACAGDAPFEAIVDQLRGWLAQADFQSPYGFFAGILGNDNGRRQLVARLGPEAHDAIDEFLSLALKFDASATPNLQSFTHWMRAQSQEIKRSMDQGTDEVRIMTVHGAKGLEAPVVFLPDTCATPGKGRLDQIVSVKPENQSIHAPDHMVWAPGSTESLPAVIQAQREAAHVKQVAEYNRLLYVAMTRAEDRLYVSGYRMDRKIPDDCWYQVIVAGLGDKLMPHETEDGAPVLRFTGSVPEEIPTTDAEPQATQMAKIPIPKIPSSPPPPFASIKRIAPSRGEEDLNHLAGGEFTGNALAGIEPRVRGNLIHALIEALAGMQPDARRGQGKNLLTRIGSDLTPDSRDLLLEEVLGLLANPDLAFLFDGNSRAEVPVAGVIPDPGAPDNMVDASGVIDRLVVLENRVIIADFKSNRVVPRKIEDVPAVYIAQLAAYRVLVRTIFPSKKIETLLVWTADASTTEIRSP
jgi:ATP-dependent helicase/nuclease subunit A